MLLNKTKYEKLTDSEKIVIDYISKHKSIVESSIMKIANKTHTSSATVSRAIQKSGFRGINELRYIISQQNQSNAILDSSFTANRILRKSFDECKKTIDSIDSSSISEAVSSIKSAQTIYIFARGFTVLVAEEFQMYLQLLRYNCVVVKDVKWMKKTKKLVTNKDIVIILTLRNSTPELAVSAESSKNIGAKVISICCKTPTDLEKHSDLMIIGHSERIINVHDLEVYSRIPLQIITRTIIEYLGN